MVRKGEIIIAHDPDLRDMYCCEVVDSGEENVKNLLVKILYPIAYPIQHSIIFPDIASENAPIGEGVVCRLKFVRRVETHDKHFRGYQLMLDKCRNDYRQRRRRCYEYDKANGSNRYKVNPAEFDILDRHDRGEYQARRVLCTH